MRVRGATSVSRAPRRARRASGMSSSARSSRALSSSRETAASASFSSSSAGAPQRWSSPRAAPASNDVESVWEQMRSPAWWFLKILSVFPYYFVAMSVWFVLWLLRSKRDQYQLVSFIVSLKQAHFIAYGMMGSLMGNFSFI